MSSRIRPAKPPLNIHRRKARTQWIVILMLAVLSVASADVRGKLAGRILDQNGNPVVGANVLLVGTTVGAATDPEGYYAIINIEPGTYNIRMSSLGYQTKVTQGVKISSGLTTTLNETLSEQVVALEGEVLVVAERPLVVVNQTSTMAVLSKEDIDVLPVQELKDIVNLQAGVVGSGDDLHFRGGRAGEVQFQVNGVSVNNAFDNKSSVSVDRSLIQEVQVISGTFDAEYGQAMSGVVNTVLKIGGEKFQWNAEVFGGDFLYDGGRRGTVYKTRPGSIRNYQLSLSGPTGLPETNFIVSGRRYEIDDYLYGERRFVPTDTSDFTNRIFYPTGDGKEVAIGYSREWSGLARITNRFLRSIEIGYQAIVNLTNSRGTNFAYRLNPDGLSKQERFSLVHGVDWTHTLSSSTFYSVSVRQNLLDYKDRLYSSMWDTRYDAAGPPVGDDVYEHGAVVQGVDFTQYGQRTKTRLAQAAITSQITREHMLKAGAELQLHSVKFGSLGYLLYRDVAGVVTLERHKSLLPRLLPAQIYRPRSFAAYVQDRIEWNDITVRAGLRFEYFDGRAKIPGDLANPANSIPGAPTTAPKSTTKKMSLAPRLGISFPISVDASVFFSYGHFYQFPALGVTFDNANYSVLQYLQATNPYEYGVFGNPDIKPEKTVHYEFGYRQKILDFLGLNLNMFYKDVRDLLGVEFVETYTTAEYVRFTNIDFGSAFGFTVSLDQRRVGLLSSSIDYTLSIANGNSSDPRETATRAAAGEDPRPRQIPLNWDQRHTLNISVQLSEPQNFVVSAIMRLGSGQPYTPALTPGFGVGSIEPNSGRKPGGVIMDLRGEKFLQLFGVNASIFARVFNLLDTKSYNGFVFDNTGSAEYSATPGIDRNRLVDPTRFEPPRRVELGISFRSL